MRFPKFFTRQKGGASTDPALGSDAAPTNIPPSEAASSNLLTCKIRDINGWPVQRIAVCWTSTAGALVALNGDLYFWEDSLQYWFKVNDVALSLKPNQLFFFDTVTIGEPTPTTKSLTSPGSPAQAGSMEVMLVVTDPGAAVNGVYQVAFGPDLTTVGT
jgi:hypothetical protein